jgi:hypothetical protein
MRQLCPKLSRNVSPCMAHVVTRSLYLQLCVTEEDMPYQIELDGLDGLASGEEANWCSESWIRFIYIDPITL